MSLRLRDPYDLMYAKSVKKEEEEAAVDQESGSGFIKKKRRPANLCIECPVCGGPAPDHVHFGGQCCYSCRAFFRRSSSRSVSSFRCRSGRNDCIITSGIKSCIPCRLTKCLEVRFVPTTQFSSRSIFYPPHSSFENYVTRNSCIALRNVMSMTCSVKTLYV